MKRQKKNRCHNKSLIFTALNPVQFFSCQRATIKTSESWCDPSNVTTIATTFGIVVECLQRGTFADLHRPIQRPEISKSVGTTNVDAPAQQFRGAQCVRLLFSNFLSFHHTLNPESRQTHALIPFEM